MPAVNNQQWSQFDKRLNALERDLTALTTTTRGLGDLMARIETQQQNIARQVTIERQTNWPVLATMFAGFATVLVFYTSLVTAPITERLNMTRGQIEREIDMVNERIAISTADRFTRADHDQYADYIDKRIERIEDSHAAKD